MHVQVNQFEGPLDILLRLIEQEELDITQVALAQVCESYLAHLAQVDERSPEDVADFLVIAAKLLYLKSLVLLPEAADDEADDATGLAEQLRIYRAFVAAAEGIAERFAPTPVMFASARNPVAKPSFLPPPRLTAGALAAAMADVVAELEPIVRIPRAKIGRVISIEDRIAEIRTLIAERKGATLQEILHGRAGVGERIVSFLAILELVRQGAAHASQRERFAPITIEQVAT